MPVEKMIYKTRLINLLKKQAEETKINGLPNTSVKQEVWNSRPTLFERWKMLSSGKITIRWIAWYVLFA